MHRHLNIPLSIALLVPALSAGPVTAQDLNFSLDTIVIETDRSNRTVLELPANVTVVSGDEIEDRQVNDIQQLVNSVPGVTVDRQTSATDPFNTFGGFNIRGVGGNRVAIQVDGSRSAERIIDGVRDYTDLNFVKQVEIVRGPASVLWGADALGGLVAFETIDPEDVLKGRDRAVQVSGGYDSYTRSTSTSLTFGQKFSDTVSVLFGLSRETGHEAELSNARDDGGIYGCNRNFTYGATPCGSLDPTDKTSNRGLLKLVWTPSDQHRLEFSADILQSETAVQQNYILGPQISNQTGAPTGEIILDKDRNLDLYRQRYGVEHTWTPAGGVFTEVKTTLAYTPNGYTRSGVELSDNAAGERVLQRDNLQYSEDFLELDIQATAEFNTGGAEHRVIMGFDGDIARTDHKRRDVTENITAGTTTVSQGGGFNFANATTRRADIYIEDRITLAGGKLEITPGLRFATYKMTPRPDANYAVVPGAAPTVRQRNQLLKSLGLQYQVNDNWSVWAKYGEGFKMPTAQDLFISIPGFNYVPNPNLRPEEVKSYELGVRYEEERGFVAINAFKADYTDFIQRFYFTPTLQITNRNISVVNVWGLEASAGWAVGENTGLNLSASWQKGTQQATPAAAKTPFTLPPLQANVAVKHVLPHYGLTLEGVGNFAAAVKETSGANDFKPAGYATFDAHAKWEVVKNGFVNFSVLNMFDKRYFTSGAASYSVNPTPGLSRTNPIEHQTGPGRTFAISFDMTF